MAIFVSTPNTIWQGNTPTQPTLPDVPEQYHNITFSYPVIGQFVTLQLNGYAGLGVCEVNIYSKDCSIGTYGLYCNKTCGHCQDGETCDFVTGRCTRCLPGYQLPLCTEECMPGTFGPDCSSLCHCKDNTTCDTVNGSCPDNKCDVGWQGSNCSLVCSPGTYGLHCNETCGRCWDGETCDHVTGRCTRCDYGYRGDHCKEECLPGSFGSKCSSNCHCPFNLTCDHVNGSCPSGKCDLGWHGSNCSQRCLVGRFGDNCLSSCHCLNNQTCDPVTGMCPEGKCARGWEGTSCSNTLISFNANVTASSVHGYSKFALSRAVDGSTSMDSTACTCCAATSTENQPWVQIDLGRLYRVATVEVVSRTDNQNGSETSS